MRLDEPKDDPYPHWWLSPKYLVRHDSFNSGAFYVLDAKSGKPHEVNSVEDEDWHASHGYERISKYKAEAILLSWTRPAPLPTPEPEHPLVIANRILTSGKPPFEMEQDIAAAIRRERERGGQ